MKFTTTTNHSFELSVPAYRLTTEQAKALKEAIVNGVSHEAPTERKDLLAKIVSTVNKSFKEQATMSVVLSDDVLATLCKGVTYGKLSLTKEGDSMIINYGLAQRTIQVGKVDKTPVYDNRPDYVQYSDVMRMYNAYNKQLKKEGYKDGYTLSGAISPAQFNLLTILAHNLSGRLSDSDVARLEKMGENFAVFAGTSNSKRLEAVQFFYDVFNNHTGHEAKAIEFIVKSLKSDKRLATFDSVHYTDTVPGEYAVLSVLISHYINTVKAVTVINKSKAKAVATVKAKEEASK